MVAVVDEMLLTYKAGQVMTDCAHNYIESCYRSVVSILNSAANLYVPKRRKNFYKFWWDCSEPTLRLATNLSLPNHYSCFGPGYLPNGWCLHLFWP